MNRSGRKRERKRKRHIRKNLGQSILTVEQIPVAVMMILSIRKNESMALIRMASTGRRERTSSKAMVALDFGNTKVDLLTNTRNVISKWSSCYNNSSSLKMSRSWQSSMTRKLLQKKPFWFGNLIKKGAEESEKVFLNQSQKIIQWLKEASEEEDEDEDE